MHVVRVLLIVWVMKYNTYWSLCLLCWLYYSIAFENVGRFYAWTRWIVIPLTGLQYLGCQLVNVPELLKPNPSLLQTLQNFGLFVYQPNQDVVSQLEYAWMLATFALCCLLGRMSVSVPAYEAWLRSLPVSLFSSMR